MGRPCAWVLRAGCKALSGKRGLAFGGGRRLLTTNDVSPTTRRSPQPYHIAFHISHAHTPAAAGHAAAVSATLPTQPALAACKQLAGPRCSHDRRQARLQGGARARSTRQALYLCTLLKRTTSIRAQPALQRPTHHSPPTARHPPLAALPTPTLAFFAPLHRQEPGCRLSCLVV
jgi:hypothetical protein